MPLSNGETFAGFRIVRLLASGGMSEVYLAEHPRPPRRNARKILPVKCPLTTSTAPASTARPTWHQRCGLGWIGCLVSVRRVLVPGRCR